MIHFFILAVSLPTLVQVEKRRTSSRKGKVASRRDNHLLTLSFISRKQEFLDHEPECGVSRHPHFSKRIIGGEKAKFSELPWQAHIRISSYQCGGVLLNHWYIATAAHCVHRAKLSKISVILGEYDTKDGEKEPLDSETFKVDHIVIHPDFRSAVANHDIRLTIYLAGTC